MKKTPISVSPALRAAVDDMREKALPQLVGLVIRFNDDDRTIRDLWSEASMQNKNRDNPHVADRPQVFRRLNDNDPSAGERAANKVVDVAGYHAEELLIICWGALLRGAELQENQIRKVDLILSKSPCSGPSGSSGMKLQGINEYLPIGCASKLASFVTSKNQQTEWRIAFLSLAGSTAPNYVPVGGPGVDRLMNANDRELATAAQNQIQFRDHDAPAKMVEKADHERRSAIFRAQGLGTLEKETKRKAFDDSSKEARAANKIQTEVDSKTTRLFTLARTQSVAQAQKGIAILDVLTNVDVRRWQS